MGKTKNCLSIERTMKLSDCIDSFLLLEGKLVVRPRRKPNGFLPVEWKPKRMIRVEKESSLLILGMTAELEKLGLEKFVRRIVQGKQRGTIDGS